MWFFDVFLIKPKRYADFGVRFCDFRISQEGCTSPGGNTRHGKHTNNDGTSSSLIGKSTINGPFSIATC